MTKLEVVDSEKLAMAILAKEEQILDSEGKEVDVPAGKETIVDDEFYQGYLAGLQYAREKIVKLTVKVLLPEDSDLVMERDD